VAGRRRIEDVLGLPVAGLREIDGPEIALGFDAGAVEARVEKLVPAV
jgi:hypothetical protein